MGSSGNAEYMGVIIKMRAVVFTVFCLAVVHAQRPFGFLNKVGPKCAGDSRPTCICADGTEITRPSRNPCGDGTKPSCTCADGSSPTRKSPCADGNKPVCSGGVSPKCKDGNAPNPGSFPPCSDGPPRCEDGGPISCQDGTRIPSFIANMIG